MQTRYTNRADAGRRLAALLSAYKDREDVVILALPRGGVPVAAEIAERLHVPLDIFIVRKLGVPGREEFTMGAIASGGVQVVNPSIHELLPNFEVLLKMALKKETAELQRREKLYRGENKPIPLRRRTVIIVDDGITTGSSMRAALLALREHGVARLIVAAPVGAQESCDRLARIADNVICPLRPPDFRTVAAHYKDFSQVKDDLVCAILQHHEQLC